MGRKSKLTDQQCADIRKRIMDGESLRSIASAYKMGYSTIRERFSAQVTEIKDVANQIVTAEKNLAALPVQMQVDAMNLAATLRSISSDLCTAAKTGASNAARLHAIAAVQLDRVDDPENPNMNALATADAVTKTANLAAKIGIDLLNANKDNAGLLDQGNPAPELKDINPQDAARAYTAFINGK